MDSPIELYKIKSLWPNNFFYNIPLYDFNPTNITNLNEDNLVLYKNFQNSNININKVFLDFIFNFCQISFLSTETAESSILIFDYYLQNDNNYNKFDFQLIAMTCIFICSKFFDVHPISLDLLHKISDHTYNNKMILSCEKYLLNFLNYNIFIRDCLIIDRVGVFYENLKNFFDKKDINFFWELCKEICNLLYEDINFIKKFDINLLAAGIIQAAVVISIKREGKLPLTIKLSMLSGFKDLDILKLSKKIIKFVLGKEVYKQYNF